MLGEEEASGDGTSTLRLSAEKKEVCETSRRQESPEPWLPGGHHILVSLAGSADPVAGSVSRYDSGDAPQLLPFRLTQNTLKGNP